jgi:arginyl-tRNA synthetase
LKSAISGLAMVKIFENLGAEVIKANFFGDVGMHVAKSTWGMMKKEIPVDFDDWDSVEKMKFIDKSYVEGARAFEENPEAEKEIRKINRDIYKKEDNENYQWYQKIRDWSIEHQNSFFNEIGIEYDRQYPESEIYQEAVEIVNQHRDKIFTESQGAVIYEGEKEGLNNWVFLTSEGNPTYSAKDLALANKKFEEYDLDLAIVTTSVEQADYFKAVIKVLEKIDQKFVGKYMHIPFGWLLMDGKKTSSRMGKTAKAMDILKEAKELAEKQIASDKEYSLEEKKEIVEKVALGGLKFMILSREFHKDINYDPKEFIKLNGFSGPFIMYSYVRINSIVKKSGKVDLSNLDDLKFDNKHEKHLVSILMMYKDTVARVGEEIAPHLMCVYLYEVAQKFNSFYENCPIQGAENEIQKKSRLILAKATGQVLKNGLQLLGIDVLERM